MNSELTIAYQPLDRALMEATLTDLDRLGTDEQWMQWTPENYLRDLPDKWAFSRLVRMGDEIVAYALCSRRGRFIWLHRVVVAPRCRNRGIGAKVLDELSNMAKCEGLAGVFLKTPASNVKAVAFYQRLGCLRLPDEGGYALFSRALPEAKLVVGVHQPNYLPWLGYFYKMSLSDIFVYLDDIAFPKGSFVNRNRICINNEAKWLTLPISRNLSTPIREARPAADNWIDKHLRSLEVNYRRAPFFSAYIDELAQVMRANRQESLSELNIALLSKIATWLGIGCVTFRSSDITTYGTADARLVELVTSVGGRIYISGKGGANYQSNSNFESAGLELKYTNFVVDPYRQTAANFIPSLAVVDALFNIGAERIKEMFAELARVFS